MSKTTLQSLTFLFNNGNRILRKVGRTKNNIESLVLWYILSQKQKVGMIFISQRFRSQGLKERGHYKSTQPFYLIKESVYTPGPCEST